MRLFSSSRAFDSLWVTMVSRSTIRCCSRPRRGLAAASSPKYQRTRLRRLLALPTYSTSPAASFQR